MLLSNHCRVFGASVLFPRVHSNNFSFLLLRPLDHRAPSLTVVTTFSSSKQALSPINNSRKGSYGESPSRDRGRGDQMRKTAR